MYMMEQGRLFATPQALPSGMLYKPDFIGTHEEALLLSEIIRLPLQEARYKEFTAKRRIMSYGSSYDFSVNELIPAGPIPSFLRTLQERIAEWAGVPASGFTHALIAEYKIGTQLGWHRDVPDFEMIAGISLAGPCRMRLRRYPHRKEAGTKSLAVDLEPRSAYLMRGEARWGWQHSIAPTKTTRYSITFRTRSKGMRKLHPDSDETRSPHGSRVQAAHRASSSTLRSPVGLYAFKNTGTDRPSKPLLKISF